MPKPSAGPDERARLRALADDSEARSAYALSLLEATRDRESLLAALRVLAETPRLEARPVLASRYEEADANGVRRDPGAYVRVGVVHALRPIVLPDDLPLLERAALTYEVLPTSPEDVTGPLRAAALVTIAQIDDTLTGFHAVRLLGDRRAARMSGEPAATAARVLAAQGRALPLYAYLTREVDLVPEVVGECLHALVDLPAALLGEVLGRFTTDPVGIVQVGAFDLLLEHPAGESHRDLLRRFLRETEALDVYRYVVAAVVAARRPALLDEVMDVAALERDPSKRLLLADALSLVRGSARAADLVARLRNERPGRWP